VPPRVPWRRLLCDDAHLLAGNAETRRSVAVRRLRAASTWALFAPAKLDALPSKPKHLRNTATLVRHPPRAPLAALLAIRTVRVDAGA